MVVSVLNLRWERGGGGGRSIPNCGLYKTLQLFSFVLFIFDGYSMYINKKAVNPWFSNNIQFFSHLVQITETIPSYKIINVFVVDRLQI